MERAREANRFGKKLPVILGDVLFDLILECGGFLAHLLLRISLVMKDDLEDVFDIGLIPLASTDSCDGR
jgi:hypothetical protein